MTATLSPALTLYSYSAIIGQTSLAYSDFQVRFHCRARGFLTTMCKPNDSRLGLHTLHAFSDMSKSIP